MKTEGVFIMCFTFLSAPSRIATCSTDADCKYGGTCNLELGTCSCIFNCRRFKVNNIVCSWRRFPMSQCQVLANACEQQINIVIKPFDYEQYRRVRSCKKVVSPIIEKFCSDQSYCGGNGICLMRIGRQQPYCRCDIDHSGERCEIKVPAKANGRIVKRSSGGLLGPLPIATLAAISVTLVVSSVFYFRKRSDVSENEAKMSKKRFEDSRERIKIIQNV